jgi:hypothetical protein
MIKAPCAQAEEVALANNSTLEPVLRAVEPAVRLVPERHLRRVLNYLIDRGNTLPTNTELPFWVARADLVAADVLPSRVMEGTEARLLLVTDPTARMIDNTPQTEQLRVYWRVLLEAAVLSELDRKFASGELTLDDCTQRLSQFGASAAREIRYVLESERLIEPTADDTGYYRVFAASYLGLAEFERARLAEVFPSLPPPEEVERALGVDVNVSLLVTWSRPDGASEPYRETPPAADTHTPEPCTAPDTASTSKTADLLQQAREAEEKGNNVRAAILYTQVAAKCNEERAAAKTGAHAALGKLVDALGELFAWNHTKRQEWLKALEPLLEPAAAGVWPRAARCLYELQTIPADVSREVFAIDLPEAIRTLGRRPVKRPLPHAKPVVILMRLKKAHTQLLRSGVGHSELHRLDGLFHEQLEKCERVIRDEFTPIIVDALTRAGVVPTCVVEEVARQKLVAELLDRVCDRGYLRIGDLRDAIARNQLKMPDLNDPVEFISGDALLRADSNLAYALDGVYRRGEFYLRWIQRFSSLFFGTMIGRLLTLYIALPFGGAFMTLMFAQELRHIGGSVVAFFAKPQPARAAPQQPPQQPAPSQPVPDLIEADEVDVNDDGEVIITELKPGTITSEEVEVDDQGEFVFWDGPVDRLKALKQVFSISHTIPQEPPPHKKGLMTSWPVIIGFGVFLLLMIHIPPFRRFIFLLLGYLWWIVRGVLWDIPMGVWRSTIVREIRQSRPVRLLVRYFWSPLLLTVLVFLIMNLLGAQPLFLLRWGWLIWVGLTLTYICGLGWVIQDKITDAIADWWRIVSVNLLPGLIQTIIDVFRMLANWVERKLYAVDEWLRYRSGDSQGSFVLKAILGLLWFPIAYVFRFAFYLLVEPQINPIKHFPVVTVSHKMLLPLVVSKAPETVPSMFGEFIATHTGWSVGKANAWAFGIVAGIPGIFGFMAWEFLANWQLYRANRALRLTPDMLGSHGETMRGLLRPGFHSGTVPRIFRKLRQASAAKRTKLAHDLEHVEEAVHRFVEREFIHLLAHSPEWGALSVEINKVRFGTQRVSVELAAPTLGRDTFVLEFENINNQIEAHITHVGWADKLTEPQRVVFVAALRGLLDMAAVERVDGRDRSEDGVGGPGFDALIRKMTFAEWTQQWTTASSSPEHTAAHTGVRSTNSSVMSR